MVPPPGPLDLRATSRTSSRPPLRSPRLHVAGEVPPELSPLDAFALQSRLLAKQLEDSGRKAGRRMSRLPPLTTDSPLVVQGRSEYFRSMSQDSASSDQSNQSEQFNDGLGLRTEIEDAFGDKRPVSMHPRMSRIPPTPCDDIPVPPLTREMSREQDMNGIDQTTSAFGAQRMESPSPIDESSPVREHFHTSPGKHGPSSASESSPLPTVPSPERHTRQHVAALEPLGLAPPRPAFHNRPSSAASSPLEPTDEEGVMSSSFHSLPPRKLSSGSGISNSQAASPALPHAQRSPSIASERSAPLPRPSFNFSRPLSRAGTPGLDFTMRKTSLDTYSTPTAAEEGVSTPHSISSETFEGHDDSKAAAPSYIYSKFTLPRGKALHRSNLSDNQNKSAFVWDQPMAPSSSMPHSIPGAPPSPPIRASSPSNKDLSGGYSVRGPSLDHNAGIGPAPQPSPNPSRPSTDEGRSSEDDPRGRALTSPVHDKMRGATTMSISTSDSASTIKAGRSAHGAVPSASEMTAEEHLAKGIECHENGSLSESTYHLRLAARQHLPTAMLLYALACRHGWGMKVNEREGVEWLRKAAEYASLEIADDEDQEKEGKHVDVVGRRTRKAQFALSIYELGVSHMNGWGIEQDRVLALRCFEIAGCKFFYLQAVYTRFRTNSHA